MFFAVAPVMTSLSRSVMLLWQHVMDFSHVKTPEGVSKVDYSQQKDFSDRGLLIKVYALILFIALIFCRAQNTVLPGFYIEFCPSLSYRVRRNTAWTSLPQSVMLLLQHVMDFSHVKTPEGVSKVDCRQQLRQLIS